MNVADPGPEAPVDVTQKNEPMPGGGPLETFAGPPTWPKEASAWIHSVRDGMTVAYAESLDEQMARFLGFRGTQPGEVVELQILEVASAKFRQTFAARTRSIGVAAALANLPPDWSTSAMGVFFVMNRVNPAILARAPADIWSAVPKDGGTTDADITTRRLIFLDHDPVRPRGVSADEGERALALEAAERTYVELHAALPPELHSAVGFADSGNGFHVYLATDIPATAAATNAVKALLLIAADLFSTSAVKIDASVSDAKRLCPVPGTPKRKGEDMPERPHRRTAFWGPTAPVRLVLDDVLGLALAWLPRVSPGKFLDDVRKLLGVASFSQVERTERGTEAVRSTPPRAGGLFAQVRSIPVREVAELLGLVAEGAVTCPGCLERDGVGYTPEANGLKCHHQRCIGKGKEGFRTTVDLVMEALELDARGAATWLAEQFALPTASSAASAASAPTAWAEPIPFEGLRTPPPFPVDALPTWLADWVNAESLSTQTPPDLAAMLVLVSCAAALAKKFEVSPRPGWVEPVCLYAVAALPPGSRKSTVVEHATGPIRTAERDVIRRSKGDIREAKLAHEVHQRERQKAMREATSSTDAHARLSGLKPQPHVPPRRRLLADDTTPEALVQLLADNDGRLALISAEGGLFTVLAGAYSDKVNLDPFLKAHAGESITVDRVGRPLVAVTSATLTLGLTVQPGQLREVAENVVFNERGLTARCLFFLPDSLLGRRLTKPPIMPEHVRDTYEERMRLLLEVPILRAPAGEISPQQLTLSPEAEEVFDDLLEDLEPRLGSDGDLADISGWGGKLAGATLRIAAILQVAEDATSTAISAATVIQATRIAEYLVEHAKAAFDLLGADATAASAKAVLAWCRKNKRSSFTKRDAYNGMRKRFRRADDIDPALDALVEHRYIRDSAPATHVVGRPPSPRYEVNPAIFAQNPQNPQNP